MAEASLDEPGVVTPRDLVCLLLAGTRMELRRREVVRRRLLQPDLQLVPLPPPRTEDEGIRQTMGVEGAAAPHSGRKPGIKVTALPSEPGMVEAVRIAEKGQQSRAASLRAVILQLEACVELNRSEARAQVRASSPTQP